MLAPSPLQYEGNEGQAAKLRISAQEDCSFLHRLAKLRPSRFRRLLSQGLLTDADLTAATAEARRQGRIREEDLGASARGVRRLRKESPSTGRSRSTVPDQPVSSRPRGYGGGHERHRRHRTGGR